MINHEAEPQEIVVRFFTDTNFEGIFVVEHNHDSVSVKSRTGIIMKFGGVPIYWSSKLQSGITLSILEAGYIVVS